MHQSLVIHVLICMMLFNALWLPRSSSTAYLGHTTARRKACRSAVLLPSEEAEEEEEEEEEDEEEEGALTPRALRCSCIIKGAPPASPSVLANVYTPCWKWQCQRQHTADGYICLARVSALPPDIAPTGGRGCRSPPCPAHTRPGDGRPPHPLCQRPREGSS